MRDVDSYSAIGPDGKLISMSPGDPWALPYRGSRYSLRQVEGYIRGVWATADEILPTDSFPKDTAAALRKVGKTRGSFRVTAHGGLITKVAKDGDGPWNPIFVGPFAHDLAFPAVNLNPQDLTTGMHWIGLPFQHGEVWTVSPRPGAQGILTWRHEGITLGSTKSYPQLFRLYLSIRPRGGRLHFTENGHVWMNLPDDEVSVAFREEFQHVQAAQVDELAAAGNSTVLKLLQLRLIRTNCRPVYLGRTRDFDCGESPWTFFTPAAVASFGQGSESAGDGDIDEQDE